MSAAQLIDRLHGVRETGPGRWIARCPAHGDRSPSLSIRELDDGRVLVHDFAGCDVESILGAVGLTFADLFPPRETGGHRRAPLKVRVPPSDMLGVIDHEAHVVAVVGSDVLTRRDIDAPTWTRLSLAVRRIGEARAAAAPLRVKP